MNSKEIENQIKQIPGNEPVLENLYQLLDTEEAIAFVGAGASAELWPLWDEFLTGFVEHSLKLGIITQPEADYFKNDATQNPLETAQQLRNKIQDRYYFEYLRETFKDKISPQTGSAFTLTHKALLQLPIHNYLTLNYDAGLTNARAALYPQATTSYFFWDQEEARRIRERGYKRLVLHAHGRHDRAESIILTLNDYRKAYDNRAFVRLLNDLFNYEKLIFIGFGMTDPYIKQLFNNISKDSSKSPFQHIAFVGLDDSEMEVAHLHRERVEMIYGARVLFYPTENHHKALTDWLQMLVEKYSATASSQIAEEIKPYPASPQIKAALHDKYTHKPTNDENFKGRVEDFATLNRWANDPDTRMIAITGIGGQGKTAMTGCWLKQERTDNLAQVPVFYWSFYEDLDVGKFLEQVVEFCLPIVPVVIGKPEPISFILSVVQQARLLLVLDGLEVLQEDATSPNHGKISHPLLNPFLQNWVRMEHKGLMILTSRFHFPQLARYSGVGFHQLDLVRLNKEDGVSVLEKLDIFGDQNLLETYVEKLYGHPLALRVLASAVNRSCYGDLTQFKGEGILVGGDDNRLSQKLEHLLSFYEKQLKGGQKELLGIISLLKRPVETKSFVTLLGKMKSLENTPLAKADTVTIEQQLNLLIDDFLIEKTDEGITTHPVIRDYFRAGHQIAGIRCEVADFLKARPGADRPKNIEEVRDLVEAVLLLCDEGEFKAAHDLRIARLDAGRQHGFNVFRNLPAITEGLECKLAFVGNEARQQKVEKILGKSNVAFHCAGVSLYNYLLGNLPQAIDWRYKCLEIHHQQQETFYQSITLYSISEIEMATGNIRKAKETVSKALYLSLGSKDLQKLRTEFEFTAHEDFQNLMAEIKYGAYEDMQSLRSEILYIAYEVFQNLRTEFAYKAYYEFLLGNSIQAYQDFEIALNFKQMINPYVQYLDRLWGNHQAEFFIRIQVWKQFEAVNAWNIKICKKNHWNIELALCHLLQGWYEICHGQLSQAEEVLAQAGHILRPSGMLERTCQLDWVWALLAEAKEDYQKGLQHVNDALLICADKGFRLRQADNFVLRGRLHLLQFQKENQENLDLVEKAGDDGNEALKIAEHTGYIWAKVDALELLCLYHQKRAKLSHFNTEEEKESAQRYAREATDIKKGLFLTEKQMEEIIAQARKEFEKQTAGWD